MNGLNGRSKILIADDDEIIRGLTRRVISVSFPEFDIEEFEDGSSLEKRLNEKLDGVRLVITDYHMPGATGGEIVKRYSLKPEFSRIPFILQYGGHSDLGVTAVTDGAFSYIKKPFE